MHLMFLQLMLTFLRIRLLLMLKPLTNHPAESINLGGGVSSM